MPLAGYQHSGTSSLSRRPTIFRPLHTVRIPVTKASVRFKKKSTISSPPPKKKRSTSDKLSVMLQGLKIEPHPGSTGLRAVNFVHPGPTLLKIPVPHTFTQLRNPELHLFNEQRHRPETPSAKSKKKTRLQLVRRSRSLSLIPYSVAAGPGSSMSIHSSPATTLSSPNSSAWRESPPAQQRPLSFFLMQCISGVTLPLEGHAESPCTHPEDLDSPMPKSSASSLYPDAGETPPGTPMDVAKSYQ